MIIDLLNHLSEPIDDDSLRLTQATPSNFSNSSETGSSSAVVVEGESSSTSCSSAFVKLKIVNGVVGEEGEEEEEEEEHLNKGEVAEDCETIDEDQPDDDAAMIMVTHVSQPSLTYSNLPIH